MAMAFGLSCCSAALIVLSPVAATDRAIAVIVSFTYFMVSSGIIARRLHKQANAAISSVTGANSWRLLLVLAGQQRVKDARERAFVPAISINGSLCPPDRDRRDKPSDDTWALSSRNRDALARWPTSWPTSSPAASGSEPIGRAIRAPSTFRQL